MQSTPVFLPGEFRRQRSLVGYSPWGHNELEMTERLTHRHTDTDTHAHTASSLVEGSEIFHSGFRSLTVPGTKMCSTTATVRALPIFSIIQIFRSKSHLHTIIALLTTPKPLTMQITTDCVEHSERDGNTRPADLCLEKSVCSSGSSSQNWTWNNWLVPSSKRSVSRLYIVTLLFDLYAEHIMRNAGLEEAQAGIKIAGRNVINLRYADYTTLMAESKEEPKSFQIKVKEESEKASLKLSIQEQKI